MQKKIRFASLAAATLLMTACSQESLVVDQPSGKTNGQVAMGFSARVPNMTRAGNDVLPDGMNDNFGVYAVKTVGGTPSTVMPNYQVIFDNTNKHGSTWADGADGHTFDKNGWSYWYYEDLNPLGGEGNQQTLKYWDTDADKYDFYAYTPYQTTTPVTKSLTAGDDEPNFMVAQTTNVTSGDYSKDVPFAFAHVNGKVNMKFYTTITGYSVEVSSVQLTGDVSQACNVTVGATGIVNTKDNATALTAIEFGRPADGSNTVLPNTHDAAFASPYTYFCMPSVTDAEYAADNTKVQNGALTVTVTYTLKQGEETINKTKSVTIPAGTMTRWLENTAYTYYFKITNGDMNPIVFDGITVTSYTQTNLGTDEATDITIAND